MGHRFGCCWGQHLPAVRLWIDTTAPPTLMALSRAASCEGWGFYCRYERLVEAHADLLEFGPFHGKLLPHSRKVGALRVSVTVRFASRKSNFLPFSFDLVHYLQRGLALFPANRQLLQR
jgi:hypothetical protein